MGFIEFGITSYWDYTNGSINRNGLLGSTIKYVTLKETPSNFFSQDKNYQIVISLSQSAQFSTDDTQFRLKMRYPFSTDEFRYDLSIGLFGSNQNFDLAAGGGGGNLYIYSSPEVSGNASYILDIGCKYTNPSQLGIKNVTVNEIDFLIYGHRAAADSVSGDPLSPADLDFSGWIYDITNNSYRWYYNPSVDMIGGDPGNPNYSEFGSGVTKGGKYNSLPHITNFIAKKIDYDYFNLSFGYATASGNGSGDPSDGINIYLGTSLNNTNTWKVVGSLSGLTQSVSHQLFGLTGTEPNGNKNYLIFSASQSTSANGFLAQISDINIYGGYHPDNNEQFLFTNTNNYSDPEPLQIIGATNATYSFVVGWGSTILGTFSEDINRVSANFGNGTFKAGIWENGIWNSGWRVDDNSRDFDDVSISIRSLADVRWRIQVSGSEESVNFFNIGDKVSIGNIVAIDINENRKLLKGYFTIISKTTNSIIVETDTTFPYRRIKKDSNNHKIKVTKNVWLSGAFLNGYYTGVWNYGLMKGYPLISEMFETQWIDGIFDGGRFNSFYPSYNISDFWYISSTTWGLDDSLNGNLGLTFSNGHNLIEGDYVIIDKDDKSVNIEYDGVAKIVAVIDENLVVTDKQFGSSTLNETGFSYRYTSTGLVQNMKFYDNNKSRVTSFQSNVSSSVFSFNSWMDVNYDPTRSVTLGKDFRIFEKVTKKSTNVTNLFGYPTYDILSSISYFRNSYSLDNSSYSLGTKYKIFEDFIGEASNFNEPFGPQEITDKIILYLDRITVTDTGTAVPLIASTSSIYVVPIGIDPSNYNNTDLLDITGGAINDVSNPVQMAIDLANAINSTDTNPSYSASASGQQLTIWDDTGQSFEIRGLKLASRNYRLRGGIPFSSSAYSFSQFNSSVIYPEQDISTDPYYNQPIKFGRQISGVGYEEFYGNGWEFSSEKKYGYLTLSRTDGDTNLFTGTGSSASIVVVESFDQIEEKLRIQSLYTGGILNNNNINMPKRRYSVVEFDIASYSIPEFYYTHDNQNSADAVLPVIHFNNLNYTIVGNEYTPMIYLPISQNIDHLFVDNTFRLDSIEETSPQRWGGFGSNQDTKRYEYFYNKTDLMMQFYGNGDSGGSQSDIIIDNLKMYEVDMIPFFQYFLDNNIYKGVQVPYQAIAPYIDYSNSNFVFLDNISLGLDSIETEQSFDPIIGVAPGIGDIDLSQGGGIFGPGPGGGTLDQNPFGG